MILRLSQSEIIDDNQVNQHNLWKLGRVKVHSHGGQWTGIVMFTFVTLIAPIVGLRRGDNLQLFISPLLKYEEWLYNIIDNKFFEINSLEPPIGTCRNAKNENFEFCFDCGKNVFKWTKKETPRSFWLELSLGSWYYIRPNTQNMAILAENRRLRLKVMLRGPKVWVSQFNFKCHRGSFEVHWNTFWP